MFGRGHGGKPAWVIVGLGNPGPSYARTKHNVGARVVEELASRAGADLKRTRGQMRVTDTTVDGIPVALGIPTTYMNDSGRPIARLVKKEGVPPSQLLVVQDELDLAPGVVRLKVGGGTAGHNGLRSIEAALRSRDFLRVRIGVGKPPSKDEGADHVLTSFAPGERELVEDAMQRAITGIETLLRDGIDAAQNALHAPK